jgi:hypothetical protein
LSDRGGGEGYSCQIEEGEGYTCQIGEEGRVIPVK